MFSLRGVGNHEAIPLQAHRERGGMQERGGEAWQNIAQQLQEQVYLQQQLLDAVPIPVFYKDDALRYRGCNEAFARVLGLKREEILGKTADDLVPRDLAKDYHRGDRQALSLGRHFYEGVMTYADGTLRDVLFHKQAYHRLDGGIGGVIGSFQDISKQRSAEREVFRLAHFDPLTGLSNRRHFLRRTLNLYEEGRAQGVVLAIDLDNFKILHDTLGHDFCNRLLVQVGNRLQQFVGSDGEVARLSEDKFALACLGSEVCGETQALRVMAQVAEPFSLGGQTVHVTACVGIALLGANGGTPESVLRSAESALRQAKRLGRGNYRLFDGALDCDILEKIALEADLRHAVRRGELRLVYQPQVDLGQRRLTGFEALLRWDHPERGLITPERFIPLAEQSGLIHEIGDWVLREACRQNRAWQELGSRPLRMAVNLSGVQLRQEGFIEQVRRVLRTSCLDPDLLELELTESSIMEQTESNIRVLDGLKGLGVHLSVDDFGTGYSSLAYLKRFPLDKIKIDRSFVKELPQAEEDGVIVEAIIAMAHRLGMRVVAEGVETDAQVDFLWRQGCELAQGFLFGRPLTAEDAGQRVLANGQR